MLCCAQSCGTLGDPVGCSPPGSSVHGIFQARTLEWAAISSSMGLFPSEESKLPLSPLLCWQADSLALCHMGSHFHQLLTISPNFSLSMVESLLHLPWSHSFNDIPCSVAPNSFTSTQLEISPNSNYSSELLVRCTHVYIHDANINKLLFFSYPVSGQLNLPGSTLED